MKKLIILLLFLWCPLTVFAEELPPRGMGISVTKENSPIHWGYCEDYAELLKKAFKAKMKNKYHRRGWGTCYDFVITRNGDIVDMRETIYQNNYFDSIVKDIILSVKPIPFYEGMNEESIMFSVYLGYQKHDNIEISVGANAYRDIYSIDVDLKK